MSVECCAVYICIIGKYRLCYDSSRTCVVCTCLILCINEGQVA